MRRRLYDLVEWMERNEPSNALEWFGGVILFCVVLFAVLVMLVWRP